MALFPGPPGPGFPRFLGVGFRPGFGSLWASLFGPVWGRFWPVSGPSWRVWALFPSFWCPFGLVFPRFSACFRRVFGCFPGLFSGPSARKTRFWALQQGPLRAPKLAGLGPLFGPFRPARPFPGPKGPKSLINQGPPWGSGPGFPWFSLVWALFRLFPGLRPRDPQSLPTGYRVWGPFWPGFRPFWLFFGLFWPLWPPSPFLALTGPWLGLGSPFWGPFGPFSPLLAGPSGPRQKAPSRGMLPGPGAPNVPLLGCFGPYFGLFLGLRPNQASFYSVFSRSEKTL